MKRTTILFMAALLLIAGDSCFGCTAYVDQEVKFMRTVDPNAPVTLHEYLKAAALNNAGLKAAFEQWKVAVEQTPQARSLPDPRFTYSYFIEEVETRVGPQEHKLGIMQTFPWFGEIEARTDAASSAAKAAHKRYESARLKLFFETSDAFYEYAFLARAIKIAGDNLTLIKHFEEVARTKYAAATASHPDVVRAQIELAQLDDKLKSLEQLRNPVMARLDSVINRHSGSALAWPEKEQYVAINIDQEKLRELLVQNNPELGALDMESQSAKSRVELAKKGFYPDLGVGVEWIPTGDRSGVSGGGTDPVILMFSMNLPVWRKNYKAAELQAKANLRKVSQQKVETQNNLLARFEQVLYDFDDSARKARLYKDVLTPKAEQLLAVSQSAYRAGTIDFLYLIDAQRTLLAYQLSYERAVTDNMQKRAQLEMLVGSPLSEATRKNG